jgi:hypothetical protein
MGIKETILSVSVEGYNNGLKDGRADEREKIIKLIYEYGIKHNSHPYFLDVMRLIDPDKDY